MICCCIAADCGFSFHLSDSMSHSCPADRKTICSTQYLSIRGSPPPPPPQKKSMVICIQKILDFCLLQKIFAVGYRGSFLYLIYKEAFVLVQISKPQIFNLNLQLKGKAESHFYNPNKNGITKGLDFFLKKCSDLLLRLPPSSGFLLFCLGTSALPGF